MSFGVLSWNHGPWEVSNGRSLAREEKQSLECLLGSLKNIEWHQVKQDKGLESDSYLRVVVEQRMKIKIYHRRWSESPQDQRMEVKVRYDLSLEL